MNRVWAVVVVLLLFPALAKTQGHSDHETQCMPGMVMPGCPEGGLMTMHSDTFIQEIVHHGSSGTSAEPNSTPVPMLMTMKHKWMLMFHANAFVLDEQQNSPRGRDRFFSTNWFMPMAQRQLGPGTFTIRTMLSFEPATVTDRQYPLLFQQGETAFGRSNYRCS